MRANLKVVLIVVIGVGACLLSIIFSQHFRKKENDNQLMLSHIDNVALQLEYVQLLGRSFIQDADQTSWRQILQTMESVRRNLHGAQHTAGRWRQEIEALNRTLEDYHRILTQLHEPAVKLNSEKKALQEIGLTFSREVEEEIIKPYRKQEGLRIYDGKSIDPFKARAKDAAYDLVAFHIKQQLILLELVLSSDLEAYKHKKESLSSALVRHKTQLRYMAVLMGNEPSIQSVLDSLDEKLTSLLDHEQAITERFATLQELDDRLHAYSYKLLAAGRELSSKITSDTLRTSRLNRILDWSLLLGILAGLSVLGTLLARNIIHFVEDLKTTQQKLKESESILTATLESTNDGVLVVTGIGTVSLRNSRFCEIWSIPDEVMASGDDNVLIDYVLPQLVEPEQFVSKIDELYRTSRVSEDVLHFKDGRILERSSYPLVREGEESGRVWFFRDVTERKQIEEALRKSAEQYRVMTSTSMDGFAIVDTSGRLLDVNEAYSRMIGYSRDELLKMSVPDIDAMATPDDVLAQHQKIVGDSDRFESRHRRKDGRVIDVEISMTYLPQSDHVLVFLRDITERKRAEEALRDSEQRLRLALTAANQGLYDLNVETGDAITSPEYALMLGYDPADFEETNAKWVERLHPEDRDRVAGVYQAYIRGELADYQVEFRQRTESGDWKWILSLGRIVERDADGKPARMLGTHTDITESKRAEEELARHREHLQELVHERTRELEAAQEQLLKRERLAVLGQLTATVSHELRNPLGVIRSSAFYLQRKLRGMDEKVAKHVDRIEGQVTVCDSIVDDLLEYTRGRHAETVQGEIDPWLAEVLDQMATPPGVEVIHQFASSIPPVLIDKEKMRRAVVNLMENAIQAVTEKQQGLKEEDGPYQPQVKVVTTLGEDGVVIEVVDNGIGMDEETAERAFEPLFTTRARGTGLGLAIVQKIVEEHGGYVFLEAKRGIGTRVTVTIPSNDRQARRRVRHPE